MGGYVILINHKGAINRLFLCLVGLFSVWLVSGLLRNLHDGPKEITFYRFISFAVMLIGSAMIVHFSILLKNIDHGSISDKSYSQKKFVFLYFPALIIFCTLGLGGQFHASAEFDTSNSHYLIVFFISNLYYIAHVIVSIVILLNKSRDNKMKRYKKQYTIVASTLLWMIIIVFLYSVIYPLLFDQNQLIVLPLFTIIWIAGMWFSIYRYRMLSFRPDLAHKQIMDNILDLVFIADFQGRILEVNKRIESLAGLNPDKLIGTYLWESIIFSDECLLRLKQLHSYDSSECKGKGAIIDCSGRSIPLRMNMSIVRDMYDEITGIVVAAEDMTDEVNLKKLSITDPLTQISNRLHLDEMMNAELHRTSRTRSVFSFVLFDIDYFKQINDSFGHPIGDKVLIQIGELMHKHIRSTDTFGRWGGEEFLIMLIDTDIEASIIAAEKLRNVIESSDFNIGQKVTCSFGVAAWEDDMTIEAIVSRADKAMYKAKESGRNCVKHYHK